MAMNLYLLSILLLNGLTVDEYPYIQAFISKGISLLVVLYPVTDGDTVAYS